MDELKSNQRANQHNCQKVTRFLVKFPDHAKQIAGMNQKEPTPISFITPYRYKFLKLLQFVLG